MKWRREIVLPVGTCQPRGSSSFPPENHWKEQCDKYVCISYQELHTLACQKIRCASLRQNWENAEWEKHSKLVRWENENLWRWWHHYLLLFLFLPHNAFNHHDSQISLTTCSEIPPAFNSTSQKGKRDKLAAWIYVCAMILRFCDSVILWWTKDSTGEGFLVASQPSPIMPDICNVEQNILLRYFVVVVKIRFLKMSRGRGQLSCSSEKTVKVVVRKQVFPGRDFTSKTRVASFS